MARKRKGSSRKRKRSTLLPGYTRLGGSSRRYRTPSGQTISRRQYENIRYGKAGFSSWSQYQRVTQDEDYYRWLGMAAQVNDLGIDDLREPDSEFNRLLAKAADDDFSHKAHGAFHDFLVYAGWRNPDWDFDVGDTP